MMLGHADQRSTRQTYLEPFRSLSIELLLMHAAEESIPKLMHSLFRNEARVLTDPVGAVE